MRIPIWQEHPAFFRGAPELLASLARTAAASVEPETGRDARTGSKCAVPSTATSRECAVLARLSRGTSTLDLDQARAEIVRIATAHGVPVPLLDFTESQQARQVLAVIAPSHREFQGDRDDGFDEMDVGLPDPVRVSSRR
jgi:hypothetical protein